MNFIEYHKDYMNKRIKLSTDKSLSDEEKRKLQSEVDKMWININGTYGCSTARRTNYENL